MFVFLLFFGSISPGARIRQWRALPSPPGEGPRAEDKCQRVVLPLAVDVIVVVFLLRAMRKIDTWIRRERRSRRKARKAGKSQCVTTNRAIRLPAVGNLSLTLPGELGPS
jgi:hypothetical protein